jgi:hypothetical protein
MLREHCIIFHYQQPRVNVAHIVATPSMPPLSFIDWMKRGHAVQGYISVFVDDLFTFTDGVTSISSSPSRSVVSIVETHFLQ